MIEIDYSTRGGEESVDRIMRKGIVVLASTALQQVLAFVVLLPPPNPPRRKVVVFVCEAVVMFAGEHSPGGRPVSGERYRIGRLVFRYYSYCTSSHSYQKTV